MLATRISMTIGLLSVSLSLFLGVLLGGVSGYYGGLLDLVIQRIIEILRSIPTIPLWMAIAASVPQDWSIIRVYFAITIIIAMFEWTRLAREVRGRFLSLRDEDFVTAAMLLGASKTISWGVMLQAAQNVQTIALTPWQLIPAAFVVVAVLAFNFLGDGLRDAADPYG
jgi:peptide/nickel transport system permease protein